MTEASFARSFLATLDTKPIQYQADYAVDLKTYEPEYPFLLPRMPHAMRKPDGKTIAGAGAGNAPGSFPGLTINLKSSKNPQLDLQLHSQPIDTSILELKQKIAADIGLDTIDKIRLLYRKRPCADLKTLKEVLGTESDPLPTAIELSVMIIGGIPRKAEEASDIAMTDPPVAIGPSGAIILKDQEFWSDLEGFLQQRLKDAKVASQATTVFRKAWSNQAES